MDLSWCCIFASSPQDERDGPPFEMHDDKTVTSTTSTASSQDILGNEGSKYQSDLWRLTLTEKSSEIRKRLKNNRSAFVMPSFDVDPQSFVTESATAESFLQSLTGVYNQNGYAQRMPRIREIFGSIEPFIASVSTMAQTNMVAALIWGSMTIVFQVSLSSRSLPEERGRDY